MGLLSQINLKATTNQVVNDMTRMTLIKRVIGVRRLLVRVSKSWASRFGLIIGVTSDATLHRM